jgi:hypothetical protein
MRYHNQRISADIMLYGTTTSVFHLAMCDAVPQPMYFTWQCVMRYHSQCISPGNVPMVPHNTLPCEIHWLWYRIAHCQVKYTGCGTALHIDSWHTLVVVSYDTLPGEIHWLWYCNIYCYVALVVVPHDTLPSERHWSWYHMIHCQVRYHNQCISAGNVLCGTTTSVFHLAMCYAVP